METTRFPQISIPKPCHEDWANVTPDARGAFCSVCSKSVWDFTNKTPDEIKDILLQESGKKICGRLRPDQLAQPAHSVQPIDIEIPFYLLQNGRLPRLTRFAAIALVTFGASLFIFSCTQGQVLGKMRVVEQREPRIMGEMQNPGLQRAAGVDSIQTDITQNMDSLRGDIKVILPADENNLPDQPMNTDTAKHCSGLRRTGEPFGGEVMLLGDIAVETPVQADTDTIFIPQQIENPPAHYPPAIDTAAESPQTENMVVPRLGNIDMSEQMMVGQVALSFNNDVVQRQMQDVIFLPNMNHDDLQQRSNVEQVSVKQYHQRQIKLPLPPDQQVIEIPIDENAIEQETIEITESADAPKTTSAPVNENPPLSTDGLIKIWPNPAVSVINLNYTVPAQTDVTIEVYDLNGRMLQRLVTGEQHEGGEYTRTFDISALPSGAYLCTVQTQHSIQTVRFVKAEF